jgi:predicted ferric reductase
MHLGLSLLIIVGPLGFAVAFPPSQENIPNGPSVDFDGRAWNSVGHNSRNSGSRLNPFGDAFVAAGRQWTEDLCRADSDGDGQSNGEELGDPSCIWVPGATPTRTVDITHPGFFEGLDVPAVNGMSPNGNGVIGASAVALILSIVCAIVVRWRFPTRITRPLFWPGKDGWNWANVLGVASVVAILVGLSIGLGAGAGVYEMMVALGLSAGLASPVTLWWAFMRAGAHSVFAMSREAAWRIHMALGLITLSFGIIHGILAFAVVGSGAVLTYGFGFFGLLFMVLGVIPAAAHALVPKRVTYDRWKMLHLLSLLGYLLILFHLFGHARSGDTEIVVVVVLNISVSPAYIVQRIYVKVHAKKATVVGSTVVDQHVYLRMHVPGFKYSPGQWAQLTVPSISAVPHPFTVVPDSAPEHVQLFLKESGKFTKRLAEASLVDERVRLQGPYGAPALPADDVRGVVFVLGGTGVTPALSLVREASKSFAGKVRVYWNMRSRELLQRCAPLLEPHLTLAEQCIRLTGNAARPSLLTSCHSKTASRSNALPLGARTGRTPLEPWLASVADDLARQGASSIMLFVCGPASLVEDAQQAAKKNAHLSWRLHVERFEFISTPARGDKAIRGWESSVEDTSHHGAEAQQHKQEENDIARMGRPVGAFSMWRARVQELEEP